MTRLQDVVLIVAVPCCLSACDAPALSNDRTGVEALEEDLGGPVALMDFLASNDSERVTSLLAAYGMGYQVHEVVRASGDEKYIGDCPQFFPASERNIWHNFDGEFYYIDGSGRPQRAYKYLPPISAAPRNETCQGNIGRWGDAENPNNNYDGGHLIAASLGGWGKRANIVPQDANFNQGNWNQIEQQTAKCGRLASQRLLYQVTLGYPNASTLIPSTFGLFMQDRTQGDSSSLSFQNVDYGGSSGTSERQRAVNFLIANGCS